MSKHRPAPAFDTTPVPRSEQIKMVITLILIIAVTTVLAWMAT